MINIQKIETFLCAAENLSLSGATKQLHINQPAIRQKINNLEDRFSVDLFHRQGWFMRLTELGQVLVSF